MPLFNTRQFNATQFNVNLLTTTLSDIITQTDADQIESVDINKQDALSMVDALTKLLNNDPFLDDLMVMDDTLVKDALINKIESIGLADNIEILPFKNIALTLSISDLKTVVLGFRRNDTLFIQDFLTKQITNKGIADTLRLAVWLTVKRFPAQNNWGD